MTAATLAFEAAVATARRHPDIHRGLTQDLLLDMARDLSELLRIVPEMVKRAEDLARRLHVQEGMLIALAWRYAEGSPDDFDSAYRGLERALELAAARPAASNLGAEVDAIVAEVERLSDAGDLDGASAVLKRAMAERRDAEERRAAEYMRLLDEGIRQAILSRNVEDAVGFAVEKVEREVADRTARFTALLAVQDDWSWVAATGG